ncbi:hypothetical protein C9417_17835 [Rhizobium sp. SEMIA 4088]|nr:hypothetical protein C9417_17835 [Rhizobium sp. SEMIA 4088]
MHAMACTYADMCTPILKEIDAFMAETGIGGFRFGMLAIRNGRLVERLRSGGRIWPETEERIRKFMVSEKERRALRASERARQSHSKINGTVPLEAAR